MFIKTAFLTLTLTFSLFASATTPYDFSVDEINAVLSHPAVLKSLGARGKAKITSISKVDNTFTIFNNKGCAGDFEVRYNGLPMPGAPAQIDVKLIQVNCLPSGGTVGN